MRERICKFMAVEDRFMLEVFKIRLFDFEYSRFLVTIKLKFNADLSHLSKNYQSHGASVAKSQLNFDTHQSKMAE